MRSNSPFAFIGVHLRFLLLAACRDSLSMMVRRPLGILGVWSAACIGIMLFTASASASPLIDRLEAGQHQTIVVYGTSLTAGGAWVSQLSSSLNAAYPGQLTWVNSGQSGKASNTGVASLPSAVLAKNPDAVFIEFGMNDAFTAYEPTDVDYDITPAESKANLNAMIDSILAQNPDAQVILQTMNPSWDAPNGNGSATKRPQLAQYYQGYREVAADRGLLLVDHNAAWVKLQQNAPTQFQSYVADGTHPNAAGYAQLVTPAIRWNLGADAGLTLIVDPATGRGVLQNHSNDALHLISYTIHSDSGALQTNWGSFADRCNLAWVEANPTAHNLSELNPLGAMNLAPHAETNLGVVWDASKSLDLQLTYLRVDGIVRQGTVVFDDAAATLAKSGDFNADGVVDGGDFLEWQRTFVATVAPLSGADHNGNGVVDGSDLNAWRSGMSAVTPAVGAALHAVPEPAASTLALLFSLAIACQQRLDAAK
jgi:lysophospholipase L1-like esterase